ncbi:MAG: RNA-binding protein [Lachnospiraceae bacterium]|nr:RNA-binding protein [Lachnospiraceae bacterium]
MKIEIGKTQELFLLRMAEQGAYLGLKDGSESVLLPRKQVPDRLKEGDRIQVFVYRDSEDRPVATVRRPYAEVGEFAYLTVKSVARAGAFLDWGLEKDLFLPFAEQEQPLKGGEKALVRVYLDKSGRVAASMKVYAFLSAETYGRFKKDDPFTGYVYRVNPEVGAFVAVRPGTEEKRLKELFYGLVPSAQLFAPLKAGDAVSGRILRVRKDGKLDLEIRQRAYKQIEEDSEKVLAKIRAYDGELPFSESASPETIKRELGLSKAAFKRALGHLKKEGKIEIGEKEVRILL